ncbi:MAG: MotA/TolQ/ExbB proton channel family protein [Planctomycetota bacterium]
MDVTGQQAGVPPPILSWERDDFECKFFVFGSKTTNVNPFLALFFGLILDFSFYAILMLFPQSYLYRIWVELGWVPYAISLFFFWGLSIIFIKWRKLGLQRRALDIRIVPDEYTYVLTPQSADRILETMHRTVQDPEKFILFNRILRALKSLKNIGLVSEVDALIRSQSDFDHNAMESSYTILKGMIWAMPVLGFIGTVQGLSLAIGGFGTVLAAGGEMSALRESLKGVVGGLSVAFGTTFEGLVSTLILQMILTFFRKSEEEFQQACDDYCHRCIVSKLRLVKTEVPG